MPASNTVIGIDWAVKLDSLKQQMAQVPGIGAKEAKALTAALSKEMKSAEAASTKAAAATKAGWKDAGKGMEDFGAASEASGSKALKALGPLGGVLSRISPEAGAAASSMAGLTSAFEGFAGAGFTVTAGAAAVAAAALAVVVAAGATAYVLYESNVQDAAQSTDGMNKSLMAQELQGRLTAAQVDALKESWSHFTTISNTAQTAIDVINGKLSTQAAAGQAAAQAAVNAAHDELQADGLRVAQIEMALQAAEELARSRTAALDDVLAAEASIGGYREALKQANATLKDHKTALERTKQNLADAAEYAEELAKSEKFLSDRTKDDSDAQRAAAKALAEHNEALKRLNDEMDTYYAQLGKASEAQDRADGIITASGALHLTETERLTKASTDAQNAYLAAARDAGAEEADIAAGLALIRGNYAKEVTQVQADELQKQADDAQKAQAAQETSWLAVGSAAAQAANELSGAFGRTYDESTASGKKAAKQQWETQHAISIATAATLALIAVAQAEASAPYPANIPGIITAGIAGAANVAAVVAVQPSFHQGGLAPDEVYMGNSRMQTDEGIGVVSRQGMSTFRNANAGVGSGPSFVSVDLKMRHQTMDRVVAECIQRGGQTSRAIANSNSNGSTVPFGHRTDTWRR